MLSTQIFNCLKLTVVIVKANRKKTNPEIFWSKFPSKTVGKAHFAKNAELSYHGTFINEHLAHNRSQLFFKTRRLVKDVKLVGAWSIDGNILIKVRVFDAMDDKQGW